MKLEDIEIQAWDVNAAQEVMDAFIIDGEGIEVNGEWKYLPWGDHVFYFKEDVGGFMIDYVDEYIDIINNLSMRELEALSC